MMNDCKRTRLSERIRAGSEAAPWVVDEVRAIEAECAHMRAERDALRALLAEALPELRGELWQASRICSVCFGHNSHGDGCLVARIDAALRSE